MKALTYIVIPMLLILNSCASTVYTGAENDDLYYSPSDQPVVKEKSSGNNQMAEKELKSNNYYDNVYAGDTLVSDKYAVPSDYDDQIVVNNSNMGGSGYDYYDDSYTNRINMFYGNYFNPYWQDPYYSFGYGYGSPYFGMSFGFGYPYMGIGFNFGFGYPYYGYSPYYYDPFYYGGYYGYPYYGYGYPYYPYNGYGNSDYYTSYGRRERPSSMSSKYNESMGTAGSRRGTDGTGGVYSSSGRRGTPGTQSTATADARRGASTTGSTGRISQDGTRGESSAARSSSSTARSSQSSATRPDYRSANRTYTPSYNNPRMSTRPSYNNSRVPDGSAARSGSSSGQSRNFSSSTPARSSQGRFFNQNSGSGERSSSFSNTRRYSAPASSSRQYSTPARRSFEGSRSSGSSGSSGFGGSSGSFSRSSSSGSSSFSGGGRSSSSSHSSGGRR